MRKFLLILIAVCVLVLTLWLDSDQPALYAKEIPCDTIKDNFHQAISRCFEINGNYVCYAGPLAQVEPKPFRFYNLKDRRPLPDLKAINPENDNGVVVMDLHVPGQQSPVRAIMFGRVNLNVDDPHNHLFTMRKNDAGEFVCNATPPGMVVRTERGTAGQVTVNGVTIRLKSSAFITIESGDRMTVANLEGNVTLDNGIETLDLPLGYQIGVQLNGGSVFLSPSTPSAFFESEALQWLITNENGMKRIQNTNQDPISEAACVKQIKFGVPITEQTVNSGHECLFQFCAKKGDMITAKIEALDPSLNPWLDLRGPDEKIVSFNNDTDQTNTNSLLCNVGLPVDGCYTLVARSHQNDSFGSFRIKLDRQSACMPPPSPCVGLNPDDPDCAPPPVHECTKTETVIVTSTVQGPFLSPLIVTDVIQEIREGPCEDKG